MRARRTILVIVLAATTGVVGIVVLLVASFIMERKMLKGIRSRAERAVHAREAAAGTRRLLGVHRARTWWVQGQRSVPTGS